MSGFNDTRKNKVLNASVGKEEYKEAAELFLALTTVAVKGNDTGATITEPTYAGYARIPMKSTDWSNSAEGKIHNVNLMAFAEATGGSSKVIGWALCTTEGTGTGAVVFDGVTPESVIATGIVPEYTPGTLVYSIIDT